MDPQAALDSAQQALDSGRVGEAREFLRNYKQWRERGGFMPPGGDVRALELRSRAYHAVRQFESLLATDREGSRAYRPSAKRRLVSRRTRVRTAHFVDVGHAVAYYVRQSHSAAYAHDCIRSGAIQIGPPALKSGQTLTLDEDGCYWIQG